MRLVWQLLAIVAISFAGGRAMMAVRENPWLSFAAGVVSAVAAVFVYRWIVRLTERRPVTELGRDGLGGIVWGSLLGVGLFAMVIVNIAFLDGYTVNGLGSPSGAVGLFGFMAGAAMTEELMYRGVIFRIIEGWTGTWIALILTSLVFGGSHLLNQNANLWGAISIAIGAGSMLTAVYVATRKLWLPIGIHFGWNLAASAIFSTEVSGNGTPQGLLDAETSGPMLVTGGDFGPEGSLYSVVFCVLVTIVFLWLARRRGRLVPMRGRGERPAATSTLSR